MVAPLNDLVLLILAGIIARLSAECPKGLFQVGESQQCYRLFHDERRNWFDAKAHCEANNLVMAEPEDPVAVSAYLQKTYDLPYWTWTGVRGDRLPIISPYWRPDRPGNRLTPDHCLVIMASKKGLQDYPLTPYESIFCDANKQWTLCQSPKCPKGLFQVGKSQQCYRLFHDERRNWFDAKALCEANNLDMAEPEDPVAVSAYLKITYDLRYWTWTGVRGDRLPINSPYWRPDRPGNRLTSNHCQVIMASRDGLQDYPLTPYESVFCDTNKQWTLCQSPKCPKGLFQVGKSQQCYKLFQDERRNWFDAKALCEANNLEMAEPEDPVAVSAYLQKTYDLRYWTWTGVRGDRIPINSPYWRPDRPGNRLTRNHCLVIMASRKGLQNYPHTPYESVFCNSNEQWTLCQSPNMNV